MSAIVCLSREGGRSDRAAPLSALASGSLAASAVCSAPEREAERKEGGIKAREGGRAKMSRIERGKRQKNKNKLKEIKENFERKAEKTEQ